MFNARRNGTIIERKGERTRERESTQSERERKHIERETERKHIKRERERASEETREIEGEREKKRQGDIRSSVCEREG